MKKPVRSGGRRSNKTGKSSVEYVEGLPTERAVPLEEDELETVEYVIDRLRGMNAKRISEFSHEEPAWINTPLKEIIPYSMADTLQIGSRRKVY